MTIPTQGHSKSRRRIRALLVDLDDTLYRQEEVPCIVRQRIQAYMVKHLGVPEEEVASTTQTLYSKYGTTLAGLVAQGHQIDYDHWHQEVHHKAVNYQAMLHPDALLREILCSIDLPKYILTNADRKHAEFCMERLGISDCFQGVFHFEWAMDTAAKRGLISKEAAVLCKPMPKVYELVLEAIKCDPSEVLFFDDSMRNIAAAHDLGIMTALVGQDHPHPKADLVLPTMHHLPSLLPELFDQPGLVHDGHHGQGTDLVSAGAALVAAPAAV